MIIYLTAVLYSAKRIFVNEKGKKFFVRWGIFNFYSIAQYFAGGVKEWKYSLSEYNKPSAAVLVLPQKAFCIQTKNISIL